jgi:hypothetical protein
MTTPATEMGIEPLVERVARAMAADQSKRLYGIDRGQDEAWEANTDYGRTELLADARAAIAAYEATRTPEAAQVVDIAARFLAWADRAQDGENGVNYLNGEKPPHGNGDDAWDDLDALRQEARAALAQVRHPSGERK